MGQLHQPLPGLAPKRALCRRCDLLQWRRGAQSRGCETCPHRPRQRLRLRCLQRGGPAHTPLGEGWAYRAARRHELPHARSPQHHENARPGGAKTPRVGPSRRDGDRTEAAHRSRTQKPSAMRRRREENRRGTLGWKDRQWSRDPWQVRARGFAGRWRVARLRGCRSERHLHRLHPPDDSRGGNLLPREPQGSFRKSHRHLPPSWTPARALESGDRRAA